jgi:ADP-ribose pyrophosphatase
MNDYASGSQIHDAALDWREVSRSTIDERHGRALVEVVFKLPSGPNRAFSLKIEKPSVTILAITANMRIVVARQFRPGPGRILYELPGGYVEPFEETIQAATRELLEETGFSGNISVVGECYSDAYSSGTKRCVVATDVTITEQPNPDAEEFIEVSLVPVLQFRSLLRSGQMTDVDMGYMALDFLDLL